MTLRAWSSFGSSSTASSFMSKWIKASMVRQDANTLLDAYRSERDQQIRSRSEHFRPRLLWKNSAAFWTRSRYESPTFAAACQPRGGAKRAVAVVNFGYIFLCHLPSKFIS